MIRPNKWDCRCLFESNYRRNLQKNKRFLGRTNETKLTDTSIEKFTADTRIQSNCFSDFTDRCTRRFTDRWDCIDAGNALSEKSIGYLQESLDLLSEKKLPTVLPISIILMTMCWWWEFSLLVPNVHRSKRVSWWLTILQWFHRHRSAHDLVPEDHEWLNLQRETRDSREPDTPLPVVYSFSESSWSIHRPWQEPSIFRQRFYSYRHTEQFVERLLPHIEDPLHGPTEKKRLKMMRKELDLLFRNHKISWVYWHWWRSDPLLEWLSSYRWKRINCDSEFYARFHPILARRFRRIVSFVVIGKHIYWLRR